ncbi:MAG: 4-hydroxy-tetrahydrodipicolinate reductase [Bacteroidales bacterium]|nr:4-hydroxy-tetrahydrodipicolinate reductase [Bacteroidales bacterium]
MKIALLGYGKMGKEIEAIAVKKNHQVVLKIDIDNTQDLTKEKLSKADVAIEFSVPEAAYKNILKCFEANVPVVSGTTGWLDKYEEIEKLCLLQNQAILYSSNFSVGVNIFFQLNKKLAHVMNDFKDYDVEMEEIHHIQKLDAPSGTAITLANDILSVSEKKKKWVNNAEPENSELLIKSVREGAVVGTHVVTFKSEVDKIEIKHEAFSRKGLAVGALMSAEWLIGKKGIFGVNDMLNIQI